MSDRDAYVARLRRAGCVYAEDEVSLILDDAADGGVAEALVARRESGLPLEHVLGWAGFAGLRVSVAPGVFVPRRRSELLVTATLAALDTASEEPTVLDLCCGSGALGAAILAARPDVTVHAVDCDPRAVACARRNLTAAAVHLGDLDAPLPVTLRGRVDVLVACAPYVPSAMVARMPPEARDHEARVALDGGDDGLDVVRRVAALAPGWLRVGGTVLLEVAGNQVDATRGALVDAGLVASTRGDDDAVVVIGHRSWPPRASPSGRSV